MICRDILVHMSMYAESSRFADGLNLKHCCATLSLFFKLNLNLMTSLISYLG